MGKDYPEYADVVSLPERNVDFIIDYETADEELDLSDPNRRPPNDRVFQDTRPHLATWEDGGGRYRLSQVNERIARAKIPGQQPLIVLTDIGLPKGYQPSALGLIAAGALVKPPEGDHQRRSFLDWGIKFTAGLGLAYATLPSLALAQDRSEFKTDPRIVDGRSAYNAMVLDVMEPVARQRLIDMGRLDKDETMTWAVKAGSTHRYGLEKGHGIKDLLVDAETRDRLLKKHAEFIRGAIANVPRNWLAGPTIYTPNNSGTYFTSDYHRLEGEINGSATKFAFDNTRPQKK